MPSPWTLNTRHNCKMDRIINSSGKSPLEMIHIRSNDMALCATMQTVEDFGDFGRELKMKKVQVIFLEFLLVPQAREKAESTGGEPLAPLLKLKVLLLWNIGPHSSVRGGTACI